MNALYLTIPIAMAIALGALAVFFWSLKSGQFEDIEGPKYRMLFDDEEETFLKNKNEEREKKGAN
ncbi:cbb3-type cytochrome oxidase assembly protein CcoS [Leptospira gomenensis]|uniref:Cbb3-type cytochrome oxidase assembly protein CcoS n=1 Tax=Leptospira gomenensis TaxID=2484974 RepID=A0A5F1YG69_9LEPT|nr:cbb3-type cytochrome oxidase assembly protein CcoS [Leptospira gomenensis]TGK37429.1 cbb3-type cytochrome oxidase assembly protein CcoS [Leptospira gomenensis]TGK40788.1 cbb3-type cytochrome oxidase assembly protein CcoS [Leptospira gomenensis]TGK43014.1 cbb3-type cytochrome oxidase assembly protein CcoS [Leptospira gomenensis]TGK54286.1 cbb3-type cytochrome oxidase assembly protein CcoS [Leptospira gomenensis]